MTKVNTIQKISGNISNHSTRAAKALRVGVAISGRFFFGLILTELEFSRQILVTTPNIKFHENPSSGRTDM